MAIYRKTLALFLALLLLIVPGALALPDALIPGGHTAGVQMRCSGVLVTALTPVETNDGAVSPAESAGIRCGDLITSVNGQAVDSVSQLTDALQQHSTAEITLQRGDDTISLTVYPTQIDGQSFLGLLARDGIAGIGTITFYDPETGSFGALGHGINDTDTLELLPLGDGTLIYSTVEGVRKGAAGKPGELIGDFSAESPIGSLKKNDATGIYGTLFDPSLLKEQNLLPVAASDEVKTGTAEICANVTGDAIEHYEIEILRIYPEIAGNERNMLIRVTDPDLLNTTGGIVQGMSGSPIIQNGKLIGAVTHVLVNDPTRGYGIFIENMLEASN